MENKLAGKYNPNIELRRFVEMVYARQNPSDIDAEQTILSVIALNNFDLATERDRQIAAWAFLTLTSEDQQTFLEKTEVPKSILDIIEEAPASWPDSNSYTSILDVTGEELEVVKRRYRGATTHSANQIASQVAVMNPRKVATYLLKLEEFVRYDNTPDEQKPAEDSEAFPAFAMTFPMLMADVNADLYPDLATSAASAKGATSQWLALNSAIETIEQSTWVLISAAETVEEVVTAYNGALQQFQGVLATVQEAIKSAA